jgi:hypothetical protein
MTAQFSAVFIKAVCLLPRPKIWLPFARLSASAIPCTLPVHFVGGCLYTAYTLGVYTLSRIFRLYDDGFQFKTLPSS